MSMDFICEVMHEHGTELESRLTCLDDIHESKMSHYKTCLIISNIREIAFLSGSLASARNMITPAIKSTQNSFLFNMPAYKYVFILNLKL